jgi:Fe(II)/alpha-ketoglutarate-dependent arginine beta-hydroxylase
VETTVNVATVPEATPERDVLTYRLSPAEADAVSDLTMACVKQYGQVADRRFLHDLPAISGDLPRSVRLAVGSARLADHRHATVVCGNPVGDDLEATPRHWRDAETPGSAAAAFLIMIYSGLLGEAIGWLSQQDGRLVTDVVPTPGGEQSLTSSSSLKELGWHTEDAFSPFRADYVGLLCLRSPGVIPTTVSYIDVSGLSASVLEVLRQPRFCILPDSSHEPSAANPAGPAAATGVAVLEGPPDAPQLRLDRDFTRGTDADAAAALDELVQHIDRNLYDLTLNAGDLGLLDNRTVVHGRRPFPARYDGTDRWLKRVNIVADLRRSRRARRGLGMRAIG